MSKKLFSPVLLHVLEIANRGFTVIPATSATARRCEAARDAFHRFVQSEDAPDLACQAGGAARVVRIDNLHGQVPELAALYPSNPLVTETLDYFLGEAVVYASSYFERPVARPAQRDDPYFCTAPHEHLHMCAWFALDDVDGTLGALTLVPGAHLLPEPDREAIVRSVGGNDVDPFSPVLWRAYQQAVAEQIRLAGLSPQPIHVRRGDVVIWHPHMAHGVVAAAVDAMPEHAFLIHLLPPDIRVGAQDVFYGKRQLPTALQALKYQSVAARRYVDHPTYSVVHDVDSPPVGLPY